MQVADLKERLASSLNVPSMSPIMSFAPTVTGLLSSDIRQNLPLPTSSSAPPMSDLHFHEDNFKAPDLSLRKSKPSSKAFTRENRSLSNQVTSGSQPMGQALSPPVKRASVHRVDTCPGSLESLSGMAHGSSTAPGTRSTTPQTTPEIYGASAMRSKASGDSPTRRDSVLKTNARILRAQSTRITGTDRVPEDSGRRASERYNTNTVVDLERQRKLDTIVQQLRSKSVPMQAVCAFQNMVMSI